MQDIDFKGWHFMLYNWGTGLLEIWVNEHLVITETDWKNNWISKRVRRLRIEKEFWVYEWSAQIHFIYYRDLKHGNRSFWLNHGSTRE